MENWRDIKGYEGIYQASDLGRIRTHENKTTYTERHGVRKWKQIILKYRGYNPSTGHRVSLWKDGLSKDFLVARLVAFTFLGGDIDDRWLTVNHLDGNRMNNILSNIELVSIGDNIRHAFENGLIGTGKKTLVYDDISGETQEFKSMSMACRFIGKNVGFISEHYKKNGGNCISLGNYLITVKEDGESSGK